jgi:trigger factor
MQVRIEDVSPVERKLIVEIPWATVSDRLGEAFRELGKSVQLKGFRKGKVPRSVLERMFGKRVREEVAGQLVRESFVSAATEHKLEAVSEPMVQDSPEIVKGEPFAFEAIVEVKGDIEVAEYRGMELTKRPVAIPEDAVDRALDHVRREQTELRPIEGREVLAESDVCAIALKGSVGEHEIDRPQLTVDLGDQEREPLPGLARMLVGLPLTATDHELEIAIPEDHTDDLVAGKTARFTVSVLDAREKDVPELDDELAKDTGEAQTLAELREVLRKRLEERMAEEIRGELRDAALKELVKRNQIPIAASLIERAAHAKIHRFQAMLGIPHDDHETLNDEIRGKLTEGADDDVRGQLLLDAVSRKENIEVSEEEVGERVARLARSQGQQPARLRAEMDRDGRLDNLRFQMVQEKVLDFIIDRATVTEKEPEPVAEAGEGGSDTGPAEAAGGAKEIEDQG